MTQHLDGLIVFLSVVLIIAISNALVLKKLGGFELPPYPPRVSILLPARNEELNIRPCVLSLLNQDYPHYQVVVLDDNSTDDTLKILRSIGGYEDRLRIIEGEPLPEGWVGKNWACHQLAGAADGDLLLFTDADTRHQEGALREAVAFMFGENLEVLSVIPRQEVVTLSEKLLVPIFLWSILSFLPLFLAYRLKARMLSATVGQFMIFRREAYFRLGGHESVKEAVVDDLAIGRRAKACGLRWRLVKGSEYVSCRMYRNLREVNEGFSKNLFSVFNYNLPLYIFIWIWVSLVFCEPPVILVLALVGTTWSSAVIYRCVALILMSLALWGLSNRVYGFPLRYALLYPLSVALTLVVAARSLVLAFSGNAQWKGRKLGKQKIRFLRL